MTQLHGFELIREQAIPELKTVAKLFRHIQSGAQLLSVENDDENKVFGVTFCTPPADSTGLTHILEHSVLSGSRKYPVKQPFLELVKGSLQTFLNAWTFSDKTAYPVASPNTQDFYNLADVYMDAVFFPNITPDTLKREGWHFELESLDGPLTYSGIVFNEMKGAFSSPDDLMGRYSESALFPDTPYFHESGGDPRDIPNLTYEQFKRFHETYYHPSNALIWFYGDDATPDRLAFVDSFLREFTAREVDTTIPLQAPFAEPISIREPYDASSEDDKAFITVNWVWPDVMDDEMVMACNMLSMILLDTPASPLRKALIESGLGEDVIGGGLSTHQRQMTFGAGMRGVEVANTAQVEALILDTLQQLVTDGIDPLTIEAAVNTYEFQVRELNTGSFPRGILLMLWALRKWLYGGDPISAMGFEAPLNALKQQLAADPRYFEGLIQDLLLDNPHRATVVMEPKEGLAAEWEADERARLAAIRATLSEDDLRRIKAEAGALQESQLQLDSPEALATIPSLKLEDLEKTTKPVPTEMAPIGSGNLLYHDIFTNGIAYLDLAFDLHSLPQAYLPLVPLFGQALLEMGTSREDYVRLTQRIGAKTGGIDPTTLVSAKRTGSDSAAYLVLRGKATMSQTDELLAILTDILRTAQFEDRERFLQMVLEAKAGQEASMIPAGHAAVMRRVGSGLHEASWVREQMHGVSNLFYTRQLQERVENDWPSVLQQLEEMRALLLNQAALTVNVTLDAANWATFEPQLRGFVGNLPNRPITRATWQTEATPAREGLTIPAQVNYVAKGANLYDLGAQFDASMLVVNKHMGLGYLFEKVRMIGGAYGGFSSFDWVSGNFTYASYRDPNLLTTLDVYDHAIDYLRELEVTEDLLTRAIIGTIGDIDGYELPDAKGYSAMTRHLIGLTHEERQAIRDRIFATSAADFRAFADAIEPVIEHGRVVVLGSRAQLDAANDGGAHLDVTKVL